MVRHRDESIRRPEIDLAIARANAALSGGSSGGSVAPVIAPAFVVDPINGNDVTGTGLPGNPVKTAARLYAIWSGVAGNKPTMIPTGGVCTVTFTSAPPTTDPIGILANVFVQGGLIIKAPASTVAAADTILAITHVLNRGQGTAQPWTITGTGIANYTPFINSMMKNITRGTIEWIPATDPVAGVSNARLTQNFNALAAPSFFAVPVIGAAPQAGDSYQILTLPTAVFGADTYTQGVPNQFGEVVFYGWDFLTGSFGTSIIDSDATGFIAFSECRIGTNMQFRGVAALTLNCWFTRAPEISSQGSSRFEPSFLGGGSVGGLIINENGSLDGDFYISFGNFNNDAGALIVKGRATLGTVGLFCEFPLQGNAIFVDADATVTQKSIFYGATVQYGLLSTTAPTIGRAISIQPGGHFDYLPPATLSLGFATTTPLVVGNNVNNAFLGFSASIFSGGYTVAQLSTNNAIFDTATGAYLGPITTPNSGFRQIDQVIGGSGLFGDGSDGFAQFDGIAVPAGSTLLAGNYTLTRDVFYTNCDFGNGPTMNTNGFRIRCTGQFLLKITPASVIFCNGANAVASVAGAGAPAGSLAGGTNGGAGGVAGGGAGAAGTNVTQGIPHAVSAPTGGAGGAGAGAAGAGGTYTAVTGGGDVRGLPEIAHWAVPQITGAPPALALVPLQGGAGGGGGGGGPIAAGGGGGGGAGVVWIAARILSAFGGIFQAKGGAGGIGGAGAGGGGGGGGGTIVLIGPQIAIDGVGLDVSGGAGGTGGAASGAAGSTGNVLQFFVT